MKKIILILAITFFTFCYCSLKKDYDLLYKGELTKPKEAKVLIQDLCIDEFNDRETAILKRYLSGNSKWEIRQEKGKTYAIRKEMVNGEYKTSLNGFYSDFQNASGDYQTRVIISFRKYYGFGNDESIITFTDKKNGEVAMTIEGEHSGSPGNSSYLIINGKSINIEIYEQAEDKKRKFTENTIRELNKELSDVLKYKEEINKVGVMPVETYYTAWPNETYFDILDGSQPGIYIIRSGMKINKEGIVYLRIYNNKTKERLSEERVTLRSIREVGWSTTGERIFPYESEVTVYEGDWKNQYEARFEIWFKDKNGKEKKLAEKKRMINGWER